MRLGGVVELDDERVSLERVLHDAALHADPAAMNQPHFPKSGLVRQPHVLFDHRRDIVRGERVEVQGWLNRHIVHKPVSPDAGYGIRDS